MAGLVDEERGLEIIYFVFHKAFNTISHTIILSKLGWYNLNRTSSFF